MVFLQENFNANLQLYQKIASHPTSNFTLKFIRILNELLNQHWKDHQSLSKMFLFLMQKLEPFCLFDLSSVIDFFLHVQTSAGIWTNHQEQAIYYLYSPCDKKNYNLKTFPADFMGRLELKKLTKETYQGTFYSKKQNAIDVQYEQGMFHTKNPHPLFLYPTFISKSYLTNKIQDQKIIPIMVGKVEEKKVLGIQINKYQYPMNWHVLNRPVQILQWIQLLEQRASIMHSIDTLIKSIQTKLQEKRTYQLDDPIIQDINNIKENISHQKVSLALLLTFQEKLIEKEAFEEKWIQIKQKLEKNIRQSKEPNIYMLSYFTDKIVDTISQTFEPFTQDIYQCEIKHVIKQHQLTIEKIYQELKNIYANIILYFVEKKEVS